MNKEPWRRALGVLEVALELDRPLRNVYLASIGNSDAEVELRVRELLRVLEPAAVETEETIGSAPADRLGPYRLISVLGSGGMGTVFRAERDDAEYQREVAIKVLHDRFGVTLARQRFLAERQILAGFEHPSIARMYDAGTTPDGRPFLVMELVDGEPIDQHCDEKQLDLQARVELVRKVCAAVSYAHRNLVVHRDIKPSNVLVGADGNPRLLDFGIAKILEPQGDDEALTQTGDRLMTPLYASPEQLAGAPITTSTDIFALGVLTYRLLVGRHPFKYSSSTPESMLAAVEAGPQRPSDAASDEDQDIVAGAPPTWAPQLAGDLDNILICALAPKPDARYLSVDEFSEDLRRFLQGEPVRAARGGLFYRAGKFVLRHRLPVALAAALVLSLAAGTLALARQNERLALEKQRAEEVSDFLVGLFELAGPDEATRRVATVETLIDRAAGEIRSTAIERQSNTKARLLLALGQIYSNLGRYDDARQLLQKGIDLRVMKAEEGDIDLARLRRVMGSNLIHLGDYKGAEDLLKAALAEGLPASEQANILMALAKLKRFEDLREESVAFARQAFELTRQLEPPDLALRSEARSYLGSFLISLNQSVEAEEHFVAAVAEAEKIFGPNHARLAAHLNNLAMLYSLNNRLEESLPLMVRALEIEGEFYGENSTAFATSLGNLSLIYGRLERFPEAIAAQERALALFEKTQGVDSGAVAYTLLNLGGIRFSAGDLAGAETALRRALTIRELALQEKSLDDRERSVPVHLLNTLAEVLRQRGRLDEAAGLVARAVGTVEKYSDSHREQVYSRAMHGGALLVSALINRERGGEAQARADFEKVVAICRRRDDEQKSSRLLDLQARSLLFLGQLDEARPAIQDLRAMSFHSNSYDDFCRPDVTAPACLLVTDLRPRSRSSKGAS